ncbi:PREDICTED: transcription initiation factor TFIID subunit 1 [Papilio polytes]|uniref:transcription initiation factor TFIID subunit 1 n=1 Tax=Papilio polytes TaxID=76194 RepID=UPI000675C660|nr:PREDICTED: transcription initiation factor TFIID subunit 1 [Papilio polytes]
MCDSDDQGDHGRSGMDLTGFLFGNIDESGQLEDEGLLDGESKKMLSSLNRLGFGSMLSEVLDEDEPNQDDEEKDYSEKSPSAVDFFDIDDVAEEVKVEELDDSTNQVAQHTSIEESKGNEIRESPSKETISNCPQNEGNRNEDWSQSDYRKKDDQRNNDDGYEGDMEGDGGLMPPPSTVPKQKSDKPKKLETPLAAMLPSKYANVDVTELFPDFRPDKVLLFSRLFGPGKLSSLPQIWRGVKKRRRRKRSGSTGSDTAPQPECQEPQYASDDEDKFLKPMEENQQTNSENNSQNSGDKSQRPTPAHWRFGPAQMWYDMLNVPETGDGFDYGFKSKNADVDEKPKEVDDGLLVGNETDDSPDSGFPDDAFLMVSQLQWEDDVIWDGSEIKHKVLARLNSKSNAAGWVPTSVSRTAQQFSHPRPQTTTPLQAKPPTAASSNGQSVDGEDNTWYSIFPVENEELVYGTWEDEVIWDAENMPAIPKPKILTLDPNDENIILGIPDDVDPSKITRERGPAPKVKIPHPHVKKSKILLGKAGVINVLQEDAPPPPPKSPDRDPFNISNDVHPPLISQVGMCSKIKNYYKRTAIKDTGPKSFKYGEVAYAHTSPFLGILAPGATQPVVENNMYRAPIYEHTLPQTDFLVIRTRQAYYIREIDALFVAGQECPLYEVPGPNSKRANNFVRDFLQVYIYRLFWKSRDNPRRIKMDDIKRAFPSHSESSIRKRLKLCADFKRTGLDSNWWVIKPDFRLPSEEEIRAMVSPEQCCAYFSMAAAEQRLKDAGYGEKFIFTPMEDDDEEMQLKMDDEVKVAPWNTTRAYIQAMRGKCLLQLTGPADPTGCGEGFSYVRMPNKPTQQPNDEQQPKRTVTGTDADLRRLSLNNAKALLRKFGVPEEEIKKLSRWEVIDVVRTLSTEKAKAGEEGMTKFSRGNRFSIAEHQERYKEECQRIFELQNRVLTSTEVLSTDEAESSVSEESDLEEMGKNLENMLANKKTTEQLSLEREEAERAELRKMILGQSEKKPQINQNDQQQSSNQGRVLRIVRTFRNPSGQRYTRVELVRKAAVIEAYTKIRSTKDEAFIRQFATMDETQKEEMKREKRRIQEQLRRIKRNQERERLAGNVTVPAPFPSSFDNTKMTSSSSMDVSSPSPGLTLLGQIKQEADLQTPSRHRRAKLKPDLKLKCGACGQVGHMRTNKACPLYSGSLSAPLSPEHEDAPPDPEDDLGYVDGTKLTLPSKLIKQSAEDLKRRGMSRSEIRAGGRNKRRGTITESCDYLVRRPAERRRTDPLVTLSSLLEAVLNHMRHLPDVQPFLFPVNPKLVADYYRIVSRPMDLQTIRDNLRQKHYQSREEFLADVNQIVENSTLYNGPTSSLTVAAQRMLQRCVEKLAEKEEQLMKLEKQINPLLDDNDQVALSFILENLLTTKLKVMPEAWPFVKPVNKKQVKDYYNVIKRPIDMETMGKKIQGDQHFTNNAESEEAQPAGDEKRGRGRPRKYKPSTSTADGATPRKRGRPRKDINSLEEDLQYSDSGSSELEEVESKDVADVELSVNAEDGMAGDGFDTSEFLKIKREMPDEPPHTDDYVDLDRSNDYTFPTVVKEEPIEQDVNMEGQLLAAGAALHTPQFKEEPPENWQPDPAIQDDLQVTDSEEEAEDGLWF